ncbi:MAG: hypothetical protein SCALA702_18370 [Melioribacteraceae bacterium]|nr:MAG: hypothetical protein SCALA702_18370 [Melioribacteraceae bacterium]
MKLKIFGLLLFALVLSACGDDINTNLFSPEEYFEYARDLYLDEDYEQALREFQSIILQYPGSTITDDTQYFLGMTYFKREEFLLAAYEFSKLIRDIPASEFVPESQFMLAESYYQLSPNYQLDQAYTKKAVEEYQAFIDFFPLDNKVEEAEKKINEMNIKLARKTYSNAYIYEKMEYTKAALKYYDKVASTYHDTEYAPQALYRKIKMNMDKNNTGEVLKDINSFLQKYPDDPNATELSEIEQELLGN